jgi:glutathione peroxidase-family protein
MSLKGSHIQDENGRIILKWNLEKYIVERQTEFTWFKIGSKWNLEKYIVEQANRIHLV